MQHLLKLALLTGNQKNKLMNTNLSRFCKVITYYIYCQYSSFLCNPKVNKKCVKVVEQHHKFLSYFFSGKSCLIVCMILSTVYIVVYPEKNSYIYVLFISTSFFILALLYSACW